MNTTSIQENTNLFAQRTMEAAQESALQMRQKAELGAESVVSYIQREPIKSVLVAAAAGASVVALIAMLSSARSR
jgi:ElaB/YqjD/DUF883 family membrane-anchored ribosome-binding protein